jgi:hypothetical protein
LKDKTFESKMHDNEKETWIIILTHIKISWLLFPPPRAINMTFWNMDLIFWNFIHDFVAAIRR